MTPGQELTLVTGRMEKARRGMVLFHDTHAQTAAMIPDFLRTLKRQAKAVVHIVPGPGGPRDACPPPRAGRRRYRDVRNAWINRENTGLKTKRRPRSFDRAAARNRGVASGSVWCGREDSNLHAVTY